MRKISLVFMMIGALMALESYSFDQLEKENICIRDAHDSPVELTDNDQCVNAYGCADEYECNDDDTMHYERYVCDAVVPVKPSAKMAFFTELGGSILIRCIIVREAMRRYFVALKSAVSNWIASVTS